jgi:hypothetical protein
MRRIAATVAEGVPMRSIRTLIFGLALLSAGAAAATFLPASVVYAQAKEKVFVNLTSSEPQRVTMALNFSTRLLHRVATPSPCS